MSARFQGKVDPLVFWVAVVAAPVIPALPGLAGAPSMLAAIAMFAPVFGGVTYAIFGGPALYWALRDGEPGCVGLAVMGTLANIVSLPALALFFHLNGSGSDLLHKTFMYVIFGVPFALIWSLIFGLIYYGLRRRAYRRA